MLWLFHIEYLCNRDAPDTDFAWYEANRKAEYLAEFSHQQLLV
jgi:hypothetical protein